MNVALDLVFAEVTGQTRLTRRRYRWPLLIGRVFASTTGMGSVTLQNAAGTLIPGDEATQRIAVVDGGSAVVSGQGATTVSGVPGAAVALERTELRVDGSSHLVFDVSPRILTPHARYRQYTKVTAVPGGRVVLVDAVVLHPDLTDDTFGDYESSVDVCSPTGALLATDSQFVDALPSGRHALTAFATVYVLGQELTAPWREVESLTRLTGDRKTYAASTTLPNACGWAVRISASDGGVLRSTIKDAISLVDSPVLAV